MVLNWYVTSALSWAESVGIEYMYKYLPKKENIGAPKETYESNGVATTLLGTLEDSNNESLDCWEKCLSSPTLESFSAK